MLTSRTTAKLIVAATFLCGAGEADAAISLQLPANYDDTRTTLYPLGDKPQPGSCSTWTCAQFGTGAGTAVEVSSTTIDFSSSGSNDTDNTNYAYKSFASGDIQVCATVPVRSEWTGYKENFTGFGVGLREGTSTGAWFAQLWYANIGDTLRLKVGTASSSTTTTASVALPAKVCLVYQDSLSETTGWYSTDGGSNYSQIGTPVSRNIAASAIAGAFGTSQEAGQISFATLTTVAASATITIGSPSAANFTSGPTAGSPTSTTLQALFTSSEDGTVRGTVCANGNAGNAAQTLASNCASGAALATIATSVTAGVGTSGTFTGLTASTTYDLGFVIDATVDSVLASLADQTTASSGGGGGSGTCVGPVAFPPTNNTISATGTDSYGLTADINCRDGDDIVKGWDFSMPAEVPIADRSGTFYGGNGDYPPYFKGKKLFKCDIQWDVAETSDGTFNWNASGGGGDSLNTCLTKYGQYDGLLVSVRGVVDHITNCAGSTNKFTTEYTAPDWLPDTFWTGGCNTNNDFKVTSLDLTNATIKNQYIAFINAFIAQAPFVNDDYWQIIHMVSPSRGEECCGNLEATANHQIMKDIVAAWADGFGANAYKLSWLKEVPSDVADYAVTTKGTGIRGGIGENWLRTQYTPGIEDLTCQELTTGADPEGTGHLKTNTTSCLPVALLRQFLDEIEVRPPSFPMQQYIAEYLRMLQMRRNVMWVIENSALNARLDDYAGTIMGKLPATDSDGWVWLMETRSQSGGIVAINNIERNIVQLESLGATTSTNKRAHGDNVTGNNQLPATSASCNFAGDTNCYSAAWTRRESNGSNIIGFAIDDTFWPTSLTCNAVIKVTYIDSGSAPVEIRSRLSATLGSFTTGTSGEVRTATRFISNFNAGGAGLAKDLELYTSGTAVDFMFVRVIKNGCSGGHATW